MVAEKKPAMAMCNAVWSQEGIHLVMHHRCVRGVGEHKIHRCFCGRDFIVAEDGRGAVSEGS